MGIINAECGKTFRIAYQGENKRQQVRFDLADIMGEFPGGTAVLAVLRNGDADPVPAAETEMDGTALIWTVTAWECALEGFLYAQVTYAAGETVAKTKVYRFDVKNSLVVNGAEPEDWQDLVGQLVEAADGVNSAISQAMDTLDEKVTAAETAQSAAEDAQEAAETARDEAVAAVGQYDAMTAEATGLAAGEEPTAVIDHTGDHPVLQLGIPKGEKGDTGATGQAGPAGPSGVDGFSPTAGVSKVGKIATITIVDKNGTTTASVSDGADGDPGDLIDDEAGAGDTDKTFSADKLTSEFGDLKNAINVLTPAATSSDVGKFLKAKTVSGGKVTAYEFGEGGGGGSADLFYVTPEDYGAVGDGVTDDSQAVQDAVDTGYAVYFASNKTYYLANAVTIDHDCHLFGGENTVIKTKTPESGTINSAFLCAGTLKKTTTITTDYKQVGNTNNAGDRFELSDMTGINIGDILVIRAEDQYYSYARGYYYLGGALLVADVTNEYIFTGDSLPFDIDKTDDVSVKIYSAPTVIIEDIHFVSDLDSVGTYVYPLELEHCKCSVIRNCSVTEADNGILINECVNTLLDGITISKMPEWENNVNHDHYGIGIYSSENTTINRLMGNTANSSIDMSGTIPNINTRITKSNLFAANRHDGFGMHENAYNTILEDCVIGGMTGYGLMYINRCRFVQSYRNEGNATGLSYRGNHNENWSRLYVTNCTFESVNCCVVLPSVIPQTPIQAFDEIIGEVKITDCQGGRLQFTPALSETVLSNRIISMILDGWKNCYEFWHTADGIIDNMVVNNCEFIDKIWANDHAGHLSVKNIRQLTLVNEAPSCRKMYADINKFGGKFYLPEGISINCSSQTQTDKYTICGKNLMSNKTADWSVGSISASVGGRITTSEYSAFSSSLSVDSNGEIVFTQPDGNTNNVCIFPKCMVYVPKNHVAKISCKLKNTGETTGATFRSYIIIVDCKTGLITYRNNGTTAQATAEGAVTTHERTIDSDYGDSMVMFYLYCSTPVAASETTLSEFVAEILDPDFDGLVYEKYNGSTRTGDGTLESIAGENNLMSSAESFNMNLKVDYMDKGFANSAVGVSF